MAQEMVYRAIAKWRGILVYAVLQACMRFTTGLIYQGSPAPAVRMYASLALVATSIYTLVRTWQLIMADTDGDEGWPPIWS